MKHLAHALSVVCSLSVTHVLSVIHTLWRASRSRALSSLTLPSFTLSSQALWPCIMTGLALSGLATAARAEPFRLIVPDAETPLVPNSVMELAEQGGYFDRAGVEVTFIRVGQSPMVMAALRAGEGEMANVSLETLLQAVAAGADDLRAVTSPNKSLPYLIAGKDIASVSDLAGKRFGIGRIGSVDHLLSLRVLQAAGVDPATLDLVALGQPQARAQALIAGQIDATTMSIGTFTAIDDIAGISVLIDMADYFDAAPILSKLNVVTTQTLASRRAETEAVILALTLAARDFEADPGAWVTAMKRARPDVPEADLRLLASAFQGSWSVNGGLSASGLREAQAWLHEGEDFTGIPPAPLADFADFGPLDSVLAQIGHSDAGDPGARAAGAKSGGHESGGQADAGQTAASKEDRDRQQPDQEEQGQKERRAP